MPDYSDDEYEDLEDGESLVVPDNDELTDFEQEFLAQIEADKSWALDFYSARNEEFQRMERWYHKEHYSTQAEVPAGEIMDEDTDDSEHLTIINIPTNIINTVHGIFTDEDYFTKAMSSIGRKSQEAALKTERFCHGTVWINRQVQGTDPIEDACLDMLTLGWGCIYSYWDPNRAKIARSKTAGRAKDVLDFYAYPIVVRRIHPMDIYPLPNGVHERWRGILWVVNRSVREIEDEWNVILEPHLCYEDGEVKVNPDTGEPIYEFYHPDELVEYVDYWCWRRDDGDGGDDWTLWHAVTAAGQFVKRPTPMPEYEMLPYEIFFCRTSSSNAGSRMGLSFLYPIIEPVQEMELLANRITRMIELYADPMLVVKNGEGGRDTDIEKGPGTVLELDSDGEAYYLSWQGTPPTVEQLFRFWRESAQDAFPPVMTGMQGGTSGLDTAALQQGGKVQTNKPRRNFELAIQRLNTKIIRLAQRFSWEDPIYVVGQRVEGDEEMSFDFSIKGREMRGYENTKVTVRGRFPQEELRNVALATQLVAAEVMSGREASEKYLYSQDPERSFRMVLEERFIKDPKWSDFFFNKYAMLPAKSPLTMAVEEMSGMGGGMGEMPMGADMATNMAGADAANALAMDASQAQAGAQRTAVESNFMSSILGGTPSAPQPF